MALRLILSGDASLTEIGKPIAASERCLCCHLADWFALCALLATKRFWGARRADYPI